jgi:uncharacterized membrane protein YccC
MTDAMLAQLREALRAKYDAADAWLKQAAQNPHAKAEQLQVAHVKMLSQAYVEFKTQLEALS